MTKEEIEARKNSKSTFIDAGKEFNLDEWISSFHDVTPHLRACMMIAYQKGRQQCVNDVVDAIIGVV